MVSYNNVSGSGDSGITVCKDAARGDGFPTGITINHNTIRDIANAGIYLERNDSVPMSGVTISINSNSFENCGMSGLNDFFDGVFTGYFPWLTCLYDNVSGITGVTVTCDNNNIVKNGTYNPIYNRTGSGSVIPFSPSLHAF